MTTNTTSQPFLLSFGRRMGKTLTTRKRALVQDMLPTLAVTAELFKTEKPLVLEIGFGGGEHLAAQAARSNDALFIGCEPFMNGVASLLVLMDDHGLDNIKIWPEDVRLLMEKMPDHCLDQVIILFPDPWPKRRHFKRRLINEHLLTMLSRVMKKGALLTIATDHPGYASWVAHRLSAHPSFQSESSAPFSLLPPKHWVETRYQSKAKKLAMPTYYFAARNTR